MGSLLGMIYLRRWLTLAGFAVMVATAVVSTFVALARWLFVVLIVLGCALFLAGAVRTLFGWAKREGARPFWRR